jgi:hypothetical protein
MTVSLGTRQDMRTMDAEGVPRAEIARRLGAVRTAVAKYAGFEGMSPRHSVACRQARPYLGAVGARAAWIESVLEAGAPRKLRSVVKRIYDRLLAGSADTKSRAPA